LRCFRGLEGRRRWGWEWLGGYKLRITWLGIRKLKKQRLRSPTFFVNLQIVFACLEKVGDLGVYQVSFAEYL
jgi:hypothetical protein